MQGLTYSVSRFYLRRNPGIMSLQAFITADHFYTPAECVVVWGLIWERPCWILTPLLPPIHPSRSCNQSHIKTNKASLSRGYLPLPLYYSACMNVKQRRVHVLGSWTPARPSERSSVFPSGFLFLTCRPCDGGRGSCAANLATAETRNFTSSASDQGARQAKRCDHHFWERKASKDFHRPGSLFTFSYTFLKISHFPSHFPKSKQDVHFPDFFGVVLRQALPTSFCCRGW